MSKIERVTLHVNLDGGANDFFINVSVIFTETWVKSIPSIIFLATLALSRLFSTSLLSHGKNIDSTSFSMTSWKKPFAVRLSKTAGTRVER